MDRQTIESELGLELPNNFEIYDKNHLGSSFNVVKSNGFVDWKKNNK
jgi:hypothetical protein